MKQTAGMRPMHPRTIRSWCLPRESSRTRGYTLIELLVVLVLMGVAAALVVPAFRAPPHDGGQLTSVLLQARTLAARRGEVMYLRVSASGNWMLDGGASALERDLAHGTVAPFARVPVTVIVSPLGSCAMDASSAAAVGNLPLNSLTCEVEDSRRRSDSVASRLATP